MELGLKIMVYIKREKLKIKLGQIKVVLIVMSNYSQFKA